MLILLEVEDFQKKISRGLIEIPCRFGIFLAPGNYWESVQYLVYVRHEKLFKKNCTRDPV